MRRVAPVVLILVAISGCSTDPTASPEYLALEQQFADVALPLDDAEVRASSDSIPEGAVAIAGTSKCGMSRLSDTFDDEGVEIVEERFFCESELSDARATGTEEYPVITTRIVSPGVGGLWTVDDATLTNDGGVWRGTGHGVVDMAGVLPMAEGLWPFNYGEVHYIGERGYEGLEMHLYITGTNYDFALVGWIVEAG